MSSHHTSEKFHKKGNWFGKPYYFFGDYLWNKFNRRILKLPINSRLSCPNRDGTTSSSGCIFCSEDGSASPTTNGHTDIINQMLNAKKNFKRSDADTRYIAYFQAFTNTYADTKKLKKLYDEALADMDIIGLMIATRPDCLSDEVLELISRYRKEDFELWLEIGMQTMHDRTLKFMNRGHNHQSTRDAISRAAGMGIDVCVHIILGLPGETWADMMETAEEVSKLSVKGVKIHHLHIIQGTELALLYNQKKYKPISFKEYTSTICDFIERLRDDILIHRLMGDRNEKSLVAPKWGLHKGTVIKAIEDEFRKRGTFQGFLK